MVPVSKFSLETDYPEAACDFCQFGLVPQIRPQLLISHPLQSIIHYPTHHLTPLIRAIESIIK